MYYIVNDIQAEAREGFIATEGELEELNEESSRWCVVKSFNDEEEAEKYLSDYNDYMLEDDEPVSMGCCAEGCKMSAFEYAHWNGQCAYKEQGFDENDE